MDIFLTILAMILIVVGIVGCVLPALPGVTLSYVGLLILQATDKVDFSWQFLIIWAVVIIFITGLDYVIPAMGAKKYGGSKWGVLGSTLGLLVGLFAAPLGIVIGSFIGAFVGEMAGGKHAQEAFRAGWGTFVGLLFGTVLKLICSGMILYYAITVLL